MKVILLTSCILIDDGDDKTDDNFAPDPSPSPLDDLLAALIHEARHGRNPTYWSEKQHGPVFKV